MLSFGKYQKEDSLIPFSITVKDFRAQYDSVTNAPIDYTLTVSTANPAGSKEEIKIDDDFILIRFQNDTEEVTTFERPVTMGLIQFHFGLKGGAKFIPHLIDDNSGVGTQVTPGDVNKDGKMDVVVGNKKGVFVFLQE